MKGSRLLVGALSAVLIGGILSGASSQFAPFQPPAKVFASTVYLDPAPPVAAEETVVILDAERNHDGRIRAGAMDSTVAILDGVTVVISDLPMPEGTAWCEAYGYGRTRLFKFTHPKQAWCTTPSSYSVKEQ